MPALCAPLIGSRHHQPVGLHRTVNLRGIAAHHQASRLVPRRLPLAEQPRPFPAVSKELAGCGKIIGLIKNIILQRIADRIVIDLHVRQQFHQRRL